jgi:3-dehydroquinate synthase
LYSAGRGCPIWKSRYNDGADGPSAIRERATLIRVPVELGSRSYSIEVGYGLLGRLGATLSGLCRGRSALIVADEEVARRYLKTAVDSLAAAGFEAASVVVPPGEGTKSLAWAGRLYDALVERNFDRQSVVVALGGGVVGDLAGFVAATYARGIGFFQVPTTLLAMVDASVGGKVAVDHPKAKNMIGAFHQPLGVACDLATLATLPDREYRCGLAEVVKYGVIMDEDFFAELERSAAAILAREPSCVERIVSRSCELKAQVVQEDELETTGRRAILNYGHTFAHAFETAAGYEDLRHGEAVAIGMICAGRLARRLGRVDAAFCDRQERLWNALGLPTRVPAGLAEVDLASIMRRDKKAQSGRLRFVLPSRMGKVELADGVEEALVRDVVRECA